MFSRLERGRRGKSIEREGGGGVAIEVLGSRRLLAATGLGTAAALGGPAYGTDLHRDSSCMSTGRVESLALRSSSKAASPCTSHVPTAPAHPFWCAASPNGRTTPGVPAHLRVEMGLQAAGGQHAGARTHRPHLGGAHLVLLSSHEAQVVALFIFAAVECLRRSGHMFKGRASFAGASAFTCRGMVAVPNHNCAAWRKGP